MRDIYRDSEKAALSLLAGMLAVPAFAIALLLAVGWFGYCAGQRTGKESLQVAALRDTLRITDSVIVARTDTVTKYQRRVDTLRMQTAHADSAVIIRDSMTAIVADTVAVVPAEILADLSLNRRLNAEKDTLIRSLYGKDSTQEWRIATRDKLYKLELEKAHGPRWGYGVTLGYGCGERCGPVVAVGLSYQAPLPSMRGLLAKVLR